MGFMGNLHIKDIDVARGKEDVRNEARQKMPGIKRQETGRNVDAIG